MSVVNDKSFNSVFISYAHEDKRFAQRFQKELQNKLGDSIHVWMDNNLPEGKAWRHEIQLRLDTAALVVGILSPDSIKSPWVLYEWHYSMIVQQSEPFLVHFRKCNNKQLKRIADYQHPEAFCTNRAQAETIWESEEKVTEINKILEKIADKLRNLSDLRREFDILTNRHNNPELQQTAAYNLGNVPDGLKLASTNYLIEALKFWLSHGINGEVGVSIANALGRLGKKKATATLVQLFLAQSNPPYYPVLNSVQRALVLFSWEELT